MSSDSVLNDVMYGREVVAIDLTQGPRQPCPAGFSVSLHACIDRWVDAAAIRQRANPCSTCTLGKERRASIAFRVANPLAAVAPCKTGNRDRLNPAQVATIRRLVLEGLDQREIAAMTGHTRGQVRTVVNRLLADPPPELVARGARIVAMAQAGKTIKDIGAATGMHWVAVRGVLERANVKTRRRAVSDTAERREAKRYDVTAMSAERREMVEGVVAAYRAGQSFGDVGRTYGLSNVMVWKILRGMGIERRTANQTKALKRAAQDVEARSERPRQPKQQPIYAIRQRSEEAMAVELYASGMPEAELVAITGKPWAALTRTYEVAGCFSGERAAERAHRAVTYEARKAEAVAAYQQGATVAEVAVLLSASVFVSTMVLMRAGVQLRAAPRSVSP